MSKLESVSMICVNDFKWFVENFDSLSATKCMHLINQSGISLKKVGNDFNTPTKIT